MEYIYSYNSINFLTGLAYHRKYKHIGTRYSLNFIWNKKDVPWSGPDSFAGDEYHYICSFNTGIQKEFNISKFETFFGLDLYYNLLVHKIDFGGGSDGEGYFDKLYDNWLGISPFLGIRYNISTHFSIALESSYNLEYNIYSTRAEQDPILIHSLNYFNPINALYISYSF